MSKYIVRPELIDALIMAESGGNPRAVSPKGARNIAQIMPRTARDPGFGITPLQDDSPDEQRRFANDYLGAMLDKFGGNEALAVAAYNAGPGAVEKHGDIPPFRETQGYVAKIGRMLNPISSAQAADDMPAVTPESPMQYPKKSADEFLGVKKSADEFLGVKPEQAQQTPPKDPGYAIPKFLSGVGSSTLKQAGAVADFLGAKEGAKNLFAASKQGEESAPGVSGGAGKLFGDIAPFLLVPQAGALEAGATQGLANTLGFLGSAAPKVAALTTMAAPFVENLGVGSLLSYLTTPGGEDERGNAALASAAGSVISPLVTGGISKVIKGFNPSESAKVMQKMGVVPTVGQGIDQGSMLGRIISSWEKYNTSKPFLGEFITNAENRAGQEGLDAIFNKNVRVPRQSVKSGQFIRTYGVEPEGLTMQGKLNSAYDQLKNSYRALYSGNKVKANTITDYTNDIINRNTVGLSESEIKALKAQVNTLFENKANDGFIDANTMKFISSDIRNKANNYKAKNRSVAEQNMGHVLDNVNNFLNDYTNSYLPKSVSEGVKKIDKSYGAYKLFEDAASSARAAKHEGEVTPNELMRAIRSYEVKRGGKGSFARGEANMQKDAAQLSHLFGEMMPDSGTPPRMQWGDMLNPLFYVNAGLGLGMGVGSTRPVQKYLLGGYDFQHPTAQFIDKYLGSKSVPGGAGLGYYLYDQSR